MLSETTMFGDASMDFFRSAGRRRRDCPQMYLKTAIRLACFIAFYVLLIFMAQTCWQALPPAIVPGLTTFTALLTEEIMRANAAKDTGDQLCKTNLKPTGSTS